MKILKAYDLAAKGADLINKGKFEEALKCYNEALEINPRFLEAWVDKGIAFNLLNKPEDAIKCWDKSIEINANFFKSWYLKGGALWNLGRLEEALECYDNALKIKPGNSIIEGEREAVEIELKKRNSTPDTKAKPAQNI